MRTSGASTYRSIDSHNTSSTDGHSSRNSGVGDGGGRLRVVRARSRAPSRHSPRLGCYTRPDVQAVRHDVPRRTSQPIGSVHTSIRGGPPVASPPRSSVDASRLTRSLQDRTRPHSVYAHAGQLSMHILGNENGRALAHRVCRHETDVTIECSSRVVQQQQQPGVIAQSSTTSAARATRIHITTPKPDVPRNSNPETLGTRIRGTPQDTMPRHMLHPRVLPFIRAQAPCRTGTEAGAMESSRSGHTSRSERAMTSRSCGSKAKERCGNESSILGNGNADDKATAPINGNTVTYDMVTTRDTANYTSTSSSTRDNVARHRGGTEINPDNHRPAVVSLTARLTRMTPSRGRRSKPIRPPRSLRDHNAFASCRIQQGQGSSNAPASSLHPVLSYSPALAVRSRPARNVCSSVTNPSIGSHMTDGAPFAEHGDSAETGSRLAHQEPHRFSCSSFVGAESSENTFFSVQGIPSNHSRQPSHTPRSLSTMNIVSTEESMLALSPYEATSNPTMQSASVSDENDCVKSTTMRESVGLQEPHTRGHTGANTSSQCTKQTRSLVQLRPQQQQSPPPPPPQKQQHVRHRHVDLAEEKAYAVADAVMQNCIASASADERAYAAGRGVNTLFTDMLHELMHDKPTDAHDWMLHWFSARLKRATTCTANRE